MLRALWRSVALLVVVAAALSAQTRTPPPDRAAPSAADSSIDPLHQRGENVTISLLTMSTGERIWELFGHDAIWIHDNVTGRDTVFNWGVFSFQQQNFIVRFLQGRMLYAMGSDSLPWILIAYRYLNRTVLAQELDLTPAQRDAVLKRIQWYARPENVNYRYDYFLDNCATRVRDIIDEALGGQIRAQANELTGTTFRSHALRLMQGDRPLVVGVDIGLARPSDENLTKWRTMFLPMQLHDFVSTLEVRDSTGASRPLVRRESVLYQSTRPPEPSTPPRLWIWLLSLGVVIAGLFFWLGLRAMAGARWARRTSALTVGLWTLVLGLVGTVVALLWGVTDHSAAHNNENILLFNPLWLVLTVLAASALWTGRPSRWARITALGTAGLAVIALLMHVVRLSAQDNLALVGLILPPALAIVWLLIARGPVPGAGYQSERKARS